MCLHFCLCLPSADLPALCHPGYWGPRRAGSREPAASGKGTLAETLHPPPAPGGPSALQGRGERSGCSPSPRENREDEKAVKDHDLGGSWTRAGVGGGVGGGGSVVEHGLATFSPIHLLAQPPPPSRV